MEKKKLALNKEVLRQLGDNELKQAAGGLAVGQQLALQPIDHDARSNY